MFMRAISGCAKTVPVPKTEILSLLRLQEANERSRDTNTIIEKNFFILLLFCITDLIIYYIYQVFYTVNYLLCRKLTTNDTNVRKMGKLL